jgi:hypothetical protein
MASNQKQIPVTVIERGELLRWLVPEERWIPEGEPLAEYRDDASIVRTVEAPVQGRVLRRTVQGNTRVEPGAVIAFMREMDPPVQIGLPGLSGDLTLAELVKYYGEGSLLCRIGEWVGWSRGRALELRSRPSKQVVVRPAPYQRELVKVLPDYLEERFKVKVTVSELDRLMYQVILTYDPRTLITLLERMRATEAGLNYAGGYQRARVPAMAGD